MLQLSEEISCGQARLRIDVHSPHKMMHVLEDMTFLNYRLASVQLEASVTRSAPDIIWHTDTGQKAIRFEQDRLTIAGEWFPGELQKILVIMLSRQAETVGLHPLHASAVHYRDRTIMFLGGEANSGKSMSQIEGSRRGAMVVSTETTIADERGWAVLGSKNVFLRKRAKGTERADKLNQDQGVAKFFDKTPEFVNYDEPCNIDLVIVPDIDGNYDPAVAELSTFEKEFQTYHSLMNYFGLHELLAPALAMPIIDTDQRRARRADFCHRFCERPYFIIRAQNPQDLFDRVESILGQT